MFLKKLCEFVRENSSLRDKCEIHPCIIFTALPIGVTGGWSCHWPRGRVHKARKQEETKGLYTRSCSKVSFDEDYPQKCDIWGPRPSSDENKVKNISEYTIQGVTRPVMGSLQLYKRQVQQGRAFILLISYFGKIIVDRTIRFKNTHNKYIERDREVFALTLKSQIYLLSMFLISGRKLE